MDPIHRLKRPQLYENKCRCYVGTLVCCVFRNIPMYKRTNVPSAFTCISIQMVRWYVTKMHPKSYMYNKGYLYTNYYSYIINFFILYK